MNEPMQHSATQQPNDAAQSATVIALHCSGSKTGYWRSLAGALGTRYDLRTPEHLGSEILTGERNAQNFTLAQEAGRTLETIAHSDGPVHLVGHSYGGAIALHAALACPDRVASLVLYEPTTLHLLRQIGRAGRAGLAEIATTMAEVRSAIAAGNHTAAMAVFIDYWRGPGAWAALRPDHKTSLCNWAPKVLLEFEALMREPTSLTAYPALAVPTLILRGEFAPMPTRVLATALSEALPNSRLLDMTGAGHFGPVTHAAAVQAAILGHITESELGSAERKELQTARLGWSDCGGALQAANQPVRGAA